MLYCGKQKKYVELSRTTPHSDITIEIWRQTMFKKIKSFLIGAGIMGLIIFFYMTGRSAKLNKLRKLMNKRYDEELDSLDTKLKEVKKIKGKNSGERKELKLEIKGLNAKKKEIKKNVKNLDSNDMADAVDDWFKSRKSS